MYIHEQTNLSHRQHRTKYIPWNTLNAISDQILFQLALKKFINNLSREKRSPKWRSIPLEILTVLGISSENGRVPFPEIPAACTESQRLKISRRDCFEFVSQRGTVHVNNSRSPCKRVSLSTEQRAATRFFRATGKWYPPLLVLHRTSRGPWIGAIIGSNRWIS